jgi:hypothetical protein
MIAFTFSLFTEKGAYKMGLKEAPLFLLETCYDVSSNLVGSFKKKTTPF